MGGGPRSPRPKSGLSNLARKGVAALAVSTAVSVTAGAIVALLYGGPLAFSDFKRPLVSFGISCLIGLAAGLASADDAGRRYLIGVAAAVQYSVFPVWFGICLVRGFPDASQTGQRIGTFALNVVTIATMALVAYASNSLQMGISRATSPGTKTPWRRCRSLEQRPSFRRASARPGL
jgi:hypothetical protein